MQEEKTYKKPVHSAHHDIQEDNLQAKDHVTLTAVPPIGFENRRGNICYLNCVVQNLVRCLDFNESLFSKLPKFQSKIQPVARQYLGLIESYLKGRDYDTKYKSSYFIGTVQEEAYQVS